MLDISFVSVLIALVGFIFYFVYSRKGLWRKPMRGVFAALVICFAALSIVFYAAHLLSRTVSMWPFHIIQACLGVTMGGGAYLRYRQETKSA